MFKKILCLTIIICFCLTTLGPYPQAYADPGLGLPQPGAMINLSPAYEPVIIKGLTVHKDNPFLFDFIIDAGQDKMSGEPLKKAGEKLIKYFLASLAIPDKDLWVNLSPYEKNRMIPEALGQTDMGRDLLEQDYILKQLTASLIYPEKKLGKIFWDRVYSKAQEMYGTTQVPVNTFNKVWIMADKAEVFEHNQTAFVVGSHLKVMLEEDYLALQKHSIASPLAPRNDTHSVGANIIRTIILPELEREVNTGKNFANLRQMFNSIILSSWYKQNLKQAVLNQVYANRSKIKGIDLNDPAVKEQIYQQYLRAYKKGVFNYIKEDVNEDGARIPRKYFSGGIVDMEITPAMTTNPAMLINALPSENGRLIDFATFVTTQRPVLDRMHRLAADFHAHPWPFLILAACVYVVLKRHFRYKVDEGEVARRILGLKQAPPEFTNAFARLETGIQNAIDQFLRDYGYSKTINYMLLPPGHRMDLTLNFERLAAETDSSTIIEAGGIVRSPQQLASDIADSLTIERDSPIVMDLEARIRNIYVAYGIEFNGAMVVETANAQNVRGLIDHVMNMPAQDRVVVIVNTPFEISNDAVIGFLNSGRTGIIALKGLQGVFNEFYFDGHPKAVGVTRQALKEVGIDVPEDGILDPWELKDRRELIEKIKRLKGILTLPLKAIDQLENRKFETLGPLNSKKTDISPQPIIFGEDKSVYANMHVLDLDVIDAKGKRRTIRTYKNSPVITDEVKVLGVGPETIKVWRKIIEGARGVVLIGNDQGFEDVLKEPVDGQTRVYVDGHDTGSIKELSDPVSWKINSAMTTQAQAKQFLEEKAKESDSLLSTIMARVVLLSRPETEVDKDRRVLKILNAVGLGIIPRSIRRYKDRPDRPNSKNEDVIQGSLYEFTGRTLREHTPKQILALMGITTFAWQYAQTKISKIELRHDAEDQTDIILNQVFQDTRSAFRKNIEKGISGIRRGIERYETRKAIRKDSLPSLESDFEGHIDEVRDYVQLLSTAQTHEERFWLAVMIRTLSNFWNLSVDDRVANILDGQKEPLNGDLEKTVVAALRYNPYILVDLIAGYRISRDEKVLAANSAMLTPDEKRISKKLTKGQEITPVDQNTLKESIVRLKARAKDSPFSPFVDLMEALIIQEAPLPPLVEKFKGPQPAFLDKVIVQQAKPEYFKELEAHHIATNSVNFRRGPALFSKPYIIINEGALRSSPEELDELLVTQVAEAAGLASSTARILARLSRSSNEQLSDKEQDQIVRDMNEMLVNRKFKTWGNQIIPPALILVILIGISALDHTGISIAAKTSIARFAHTMSVGGLFAFLVPAFHWMMYTRAASDHFENKPLASKRRTAIRLTVGVAGAVIAPLAYMSGSPFLATGASVLASSTFLPSGIKDLYARWLQTNPPKRETIAKYNKWLTRGASLFPAAMALSGYFFGMYLTGLGHYEITNAWTSLLYSAFGAVVMGGIFEYSPLASEMAETSRRDDLDSRSNPEHTSNPEFTEVANKDTVHRINDAKLLGIYELFALWGALKPKGSFPWWIHTPLEVLNKYAQTHPLPHVLGPNVLNPLPYATLTALGMAFTALSFARFPIAERIKTYRALKNSKQGPTDAAMSILSDGLEDLTAAIFRAEPSDEDAAMADQAVKRSWASSGGMADMSRFDLHQSVTEAKETARKIWDREVHPIWGVNTDATTMIEVFEILYRECQGSVKAENMDYEGFIRKFRNIWKEAIYSPQREGQYPELDLNRLYGFVNGGLWNPEIMTYYQDISRNKEAVRQLIAFIHETSAIVSRLEVYGYRFTGTRYQQELSNVDVSNVLDPPIQIFKWNPVDENEKGIDEGIRIAVNTVARVSMMMQNVGRIYNFLGSKNIERTADLIKNLNEFNPYYAQLVKGQIRQLAEEGNGAAQDLLARPDLDELKKDKHLINPPNRHEGPVEGFNLDLLMAADVREAVGYEDAAMVSQRHRTPRTKHHHRTPHLQGELVDGSRAFNKARIIFPLEEGNSEMGIVQKEGKYFIRSGGELPLNVTVHGREKNSYYFTFTNAGDKDVKRGVVVFTVLNSSPIEFEVDGKAAQTVAGHNGGHVLVNDGDIITVKFGGQEMSLRYDNAGVHLAEDFLINPSISIDFEDDDISLFRISGTESNVPDIENMSPDGEVTIIHDRSMTGKYAGEDAAMAAQFNEADARRAITEVMGRRISANSHLVAFITQSVRTAIQHHAVTQAPQITETQINFDVIRTEMRISRGDRTNLIGSINKILATRVKPVISDDDSVLDAVFGLADQVIADKNFKLGAEPFTDLNLGYENNYETIPDEFKSEYKSNFSFFKRQGKLPILPSDDHEFQEFTAHKDTKVFSVRIRMPNNTYDYYFISHKIEEGGDHVVMVEKFKDTNRAMLALLKGMSRRRFWIAATGGTFVISAGGYVWKTETMALPEDPQKGRIVLLSGGGKYNPDYPSTVILHGQEEKPLRADFNPLSTEEYGPLLTVKGIKEEAVNLKYNVFMYAYNYKNDFNRRLVPEFYSELDRIKKEHNITHMAVVAYSLGALIFRAAVLSSPQGKEDLFKGIRLIQLAPIVGGAKLADRLGLGPEGLAFIQRLILDFDDVNIQKAANPYGPIQEALLSPPAVARFNGIIDPRMVTYLPDPMLDSVSEWDSKDRNVQARYQRGIGNRTTVIPGAPHEYLAEYWAFMPEIRKILGGFRKEFDSRTGSSQAMMAQPSGISERSEGLLQNLRTEMSSRRKDGTIGLPQITFGDPKAFTSLPWIFRDAGNIEVDPRFLEILDDPKDHHVFSLQTSAYEIVADQFVQPSKDEGRWNKQLRVLVQAWRLLSVSVGADLAMKIPGGIDLNTTNGMQWKDSKDGRGVEMNIDPAMIARVRRDGINWLSPVIFRMTPISSVWPIVGLQAPAQAEHLAGV